MKALDGFEETVNKALGDFIAPGMAMAGRRRWRGGLCGSTPGGWHEGIQTRRSETFLKLTLLPCAQRVGAAGCRGHPGFAVTPDIMLNVRPSL